VLLTRPGPVLHHFAYIVTETSLLFRALDTAGVETYVIRPGFAGQVDGIVRRFEDGELVLERERVPVDDAAGEAFDKVAKMLGLGYPGGPEIEKHARDGDSSRFAFPRSMPDSENFSFSGLKTAVRYLLPKVGVTIGSGMATERFGKAMGARIPDDELLADICASFQQAIIDVLVRKAVAAAKKCSVDLVTVEAAGTFAGGNDMSFTLTRNASAGDTIVITLEPGTGGSAPKGPVVGKTSI